MLLTDSELAVLRFLPSHLTNQEIAEALFLSINTVKTHLRSAYRKLGVAFAPGRDRPGPAASTCSSAPGCRCRRRGSGPAQERAPRRPSQSEGQEGQHDAVEDQPRAQDREQQHQRDPGPEQHDAPGGQAEHPGDRLEPAPWDRPGHGHRQVRDAVDDPERAPR